MYNDIPRTFVGTTTFRVSGMRSIRCAQTVSIAIRSVVDVQQVSIQLTSGMVTVYAAGPVDRTEISAAVTSAGFAVER